MLLFMSKHPEGVMKVDFRQKLGLSSSTSVKALKIIFRKNLITNLLSIENLLFVLSKKGENIILLLKAANLLINSENQIDSQQIWNDLLKLCKENQK